MAVDAFGGSHCTTVVGNAAHRREAYGYLSEEDGSSCTREETACWRDRESSAYHAVAGGEVWVAAPWALPADGDLSCPGR